MMNTSFELNNVRKDADLFNGTFTKKSPVVEIFSAMVRGEELGRFGAKADKAVDYIKGLGAKALAGDSSAVAELNTLRRFMIETPVMQEIKLLSIFGSYRAVGYDETIEREVYHHVGERSRIQAASGDVTFPAISRETYPVATFTVSGGYMVDYRRVSLGDMSVENEGMEQVRTDIHNRAVAAIVKKVYDAIVNATGVHYSLDAAGLTKSGVDKVMSDLRRFGKLNVIGDYAMLSQFTPWAGYVGKIDTTTITGVSDKIIDELRQNGLLGMYNGAILSEMPNPYDLYTMNEDGTNFETLLPAGLAFVVPTGSRSPIATYTRGGLTSMTGNDVKTGKIVTRFDLEVGCDVAKGQEYQIGVLHDTNLDDLAD